MLKRVGLQLGFRTDPLLLPPFHNDTTNNKTKLPEQLLETHKDKVLQHYLESEDGEYY